MWQLTSYLMWYKNKILFWPLATLVFFINNLMIRTILTQYQKIREQTDIIEMLETKLTQYRSYRPNT